MRSLEVLDAKDSPDRPGMMYESTIRATVQRFDKIFRSGAAGAAGRAEQVTAVLEHLYRHTRRRRGEAAIKEGFVEWENTSSIYELFSVDLNMFERIFFTVDVGETTSMLSQFCSFFLMFMIILSIVMWMLSTVPSVMQIPSGCVGVDPGECAPEPAPVFRVVEQICIYVFTVEYLVRLLTVHSVRFALLNEFFLEAVLTGEAPGGSRASPGRGLHAEPCDCSSREDIGVVCPNKLDGKLMTTFKHVISPANVIDLLAILPYWIEVVSGSKDGGGGTLVVLRILRLTRVFRVFKLGKYNEVFTVFSRVVTKSIPALSLMVFFIFIGCCLFGTLIWFMEQGTWHPRGHPILHELGILDRGAYLRPESALASDGLAESPFQSIIHSFWYIIVTITTVGFGDMYPTSNGGKLIATVTILNGVIVLAMPIGVVGANFSSEYYRVLDEKKRRKRLKEQLDMLAAMEDEQDAALNQMSDVDLGTTSERSQVALELLRVDGARIKILAEAEAVAERWSHLLPSLLCQQLSTSLLRFIGGFIAADGDSVGASTEERGCAAVARPVISATHINDLDSLSTRVQAAIFNAITLSDDLDAGVREAHECRRQWDAFVERCWEYVVDICRVEQLPEPPELFEMKAHLMRCPGQKEIIGSSRVSRLRWGADRASGSLSHMSASLVSAAGRVSPSPRLPVLGRTPEGVSASSGALGSRHAAASGPRAAGSTTSSSLESIPPDPCIPLESCMESSNEPEAHGNPEFTGPA